MASAKANQVEPLVYLRELLVQVSGNSRAAAVLRLPDGWLATHKRDEGSDMLRQQQLQQFVAAQVGSTWARKRGRNVTDHGATDAG